MLHCNRPVAALILLVMIGLAGCGKTASQHDDATATSVAAEADTASVGAATLAGGEDASAPLARDVGAVMAPVEPPRVTLLDAGVEPRVVLRLKPVAGTQEATTIAMRMGVEMTLDGRAVPGRAMPKARLGLSARIDAVGADGTARWSATITEASLEEGAGASAAMIGQLREGLAAVKGMTAAGEVSDRGVTTVAGFAGTPAEGEMATLLEGFRESLVQLSVPLPEEAVGPGARWQVEQVVPQGGMRVRQTTVFDVVSVEGARVVARVTLTQAAEAGGAGAAALPPGARLEGFSGRGTGETTLDLGRILPVSSTARVATTVMMTVPAPDGGGRAMKLQMDIALALGEAVAEAEPEGVAPPGEPVEPDDGDDAAQDEPPAGAQDGGGE